MDPSPPRFINASQLSRQATFNKKKRDEEKARSHALSLGPLFYTKFLEEQEIRNKRDAELHQQRQAAEEAERQYQERKAAEENKAGQRRASEIIYYPLTPAEMKKIIETGSLVSVKPAEDEEPKLLSSTNSIRLTPVENLHKEREDYLPTNCCILFDVKHPKWLSRVAVSSCLMQSVFTFALVILVLSDTAGTLSTLGSVLAASQGLTLLACAKALHPEFASAFSALGAVCGMVNATLASYACVALFLKDLQGDGGGAAIGYIILGIFICVGGIAAATTGTLLALRREISMAKEVAHIRMLSILCHMIQLVPLPLAPEAVDDLPPSKPTAPSVLEPRSKDKPPALAVDSPTPVAASPSGPKLVSLTPQAEWKRYKRPPLYAKYDEIYADHDEADDEQQRGVVGGWRGLSPSVEAPVEEWGGAQYLSRRLASGGQVVLSGDLVRRDAGGASGEVITPMSRAGGGAEGGDTPMINMTPRGSVIVIPSSTSPTTPGNACASSQLIMQAHKAWCDERLASINQTDNQTIRQSAPPRPPADAHTASPDATQMLSQLTPRGAIHTPRVIASSPARIMRSTFASPSASQVNAPKGALTAATPMAASPHLTPEGGTIEGTAAVARGTIEGTAAVARGASEKEPHRAHAAQSAGPSHEAPRGVDVHGNDTKQGHEPRSAGAGRVPREAAASPLRPSFRPAIPALKLGRVSSGDARNVALGRVVMAQARELGDMDDVSRKHLLSMVGTPRSLTSSESLYSTLADSRQDQNTPRGGGGLLYLSGKAAGGVCERESPLKGTSLFPYGKAAQGVSGRESPPKRGSMYSLGVDGDLLASIGGYRAAAGEEEASLYTSREGDSWALEAVPQGLASLCSSRGGDSQASEGGASLHSSRGAHSVVQI